jgi:hypothetical protein
MFGIKFADLCPYYHMPRDRGDKVIIMPLAIFA